EEQAMTAPGPLRRWGIAVALLTALVPVAAGTQEVAKPPQPAAASSGQPPATSSGAAADQHRLPPDSTTKHALTLADRTLAFTVTAGSIRLFNDKGEPQADIAYTAYQLDG